MKENVNEIATSDKGNPLCGDLMCVDFWREKFKGMCVESTVNYTTNNSYLQFIP